MDVCAGGSRGQIHQDGWPEAKKLWTETKQTVLYDGLNVQIKALNCRVCLFFFHFVFVVNGFVGNGFRAITEKYFHLLKSTIFNGNCIFLLNCNTDF